MLLNTRYEASQNNCTCMGGPRGGGQGVGPMVTQSDPISIPSTKKKQKKTVRVGPPLTNLSGSAHDMRSLNGIGTISHVMVTLALSLSKDLIIFALLILQSYLPT